jgi:hypothetical protein
MANDATPPRPEGYTRAMEMLRALDTPAGLLASPSDRYNYRRIWGRDSSIIGLAAMVSRDEQLMDAWRRSIATLVRHQGPHGEIPSNVDAEHGRVSYGSTVGRVDASLWFVVACGRYFAATGDEGFLDEVFPALERVRFLLGAWEFNTRGLIYVPYTGDWADEYVHSGYVLYDQLLYLQAQREYARLWTARRGKPDPAHAPALARLEDLIRDNFWWTDGDNPPEHVYHKVLYEKGQRAAEHSCSQHWLPFFSPQGYGYRFDAFANVLASLFGVADDDQRARVDGYIDNCANVSMPLLPAFHPVIRPKDDDWKELQMTFTYVFKNEPYEYHNGGLWPMITGFYVVDLAKRGLHDRAARYLDGIHRANAKEMDGEPWSFPEYVHGRSFEAEGTKQQGWSAAAAVLAQHAVEGVFPFVAGE